MSDGVVDPRPEPYENCDVPLHRGFYTAGERIVSKTCPRFNRIGSYPALHGGLAYLQGHSRTVFDEIGFAFPRPVAGLYTGIAGVASFMVDIHFLIMLAPALVLLGISLQVHSRRVDAAYDAINHQRFIEARSLALHGDMTQLDRVITAIDEVQSFESDPAGAGVLNRMGAKMPHLTDMMGRIADAAVASRMERDAPAAPAVSATQVQQSVPSLVGTHVTAQWTNGMYYGATVVAQNGNLYHVAWDDGDPALWVRADQLRK